MLNFRRVVTPLQYCGEARDRDEEDEFETHPVTMHECEYQQYPRGIKMVSLAKANEKLCSQNSMKL